VCQEWFSGLNSNRHKTISLISGFIAHFCIVLHIKNSYMLYKNIDISNFQIFNIDNNKNFKIITTLTNISFFEPFPGK